MRKIKLLTASLTAMAALALPLVLGGCNTFEGMGQDLEAGGEAIQDTFSGDE